MLQSKQKSESHTEKRFLKLWLILNDTYIHFCNFPAISTWRTTFYIPLNPSNTLNSPWTSGAQMNTELIPKAGQQKRSGTIPAMKVTVKILQRVTEIRLHFTAGFVTCFLFRPICLNQLLPIAQHWHSCKYSDLNYPDKTCPSLVARHSYDILTRFLAPSLSQESWEELMVLSSLGF